MEKAKRTLKAINKKKIKKDNSYFVKQVKDFNEEDDPLSKDFEKGNIDK